MHDILLRNSMRRVKSFKLFHFFMHCRMCPCGKFKAIILRYIRGENSCWQGVGECKATFLNKQQKNCTGAQWTLSQYWRTSSEPWQVWPKSQYVLGLHGFISKTVNHLSKVRTWVVYHWCMRKKWTKMWH